MTASTPRSTKAKAAAKTAPNADATTEQAPAPDDNATAAPLDPPATPAPAAEPAPAPEQTPEADPAPEQTPEQAPAPDPTPAPTVPVVSAAPLEGPPIAEAPVSEPSYAHQPGEIGVESLAVDSRQTIRVIDEATGLPVTSTEGLFTETAPGGGNVRCTKYLLREYRVGYHDRFTQALLVTPHTVLTADKAAEISAVIEATTVEATV